MWPRHNIFIEVATPHQMKVTTCNQIARDVSVRNMFYEVWGTRKDLNKGDGRGVVAGMGRQVEKLAWDWTAPLEINPRHCRSLSLVCPLNGWFKHPVREALRQTILTTKS